MNSNKKSTPARGVPQPFSRQAGSARQLKPLVAQLKTGMPAQSGKRPVAPPVYHPKQAPTIVQTKVETGRTSKSAPNFRGAVQQTVPGVLQTKSSQSRQTGQASHHPVAPPIYRPEAKKIVQPKTISQPGKLSTAPPVYRPAKIANLVQPITANRTASSFSAVQMAQAEKKAHECSAKVVSNGGDEYSGEYEDIHAEINALEKYFKGGGDVAGIKRIELSSPPCKYCHIILSDLGIRDRVLLTKADRRKYGRCQGGSYGWFVRGGYVWNAIKAATGAADPDKYADSVSERRMKL